MKTVTYLYTPKPNTWLLHLWQQLQPHGVLVKKLRAWTFLPIPLGISLQGPPGWMGNIGTQPFSALSIDVQLDSGLGSGWATQGHAQTFSEATPLFSLCVLRVVMMECKPSSKSEVQSALEQVFFREKIQH